MSNICFYTDINLLLDQNLNGTNDKEFGPIDLLNYRVTNLNTASSDPAVYAVCDGSILVQKDSVNTNVYNLLLKPLAASLIDGVKIKYIIYKGIKKESLIDAIDSNKIAPVGTNALIDIIWEEQNERNTKEGTSFEPSIKSLGLNFDSSATGIDLRIDTDPLDEVFFLSNKLFAPPIVNSGWKIGTFDKDNFGIEIIIDDFGYSPTFKTLRTKDNIIIVPNITASTIQQKIEDNANRKTILNYLDPICLFSMNYSNGVTCYDVTSANLLKTTTLYSQVLSKFKNRSKIYLDLRNENGLYYNYYDNYENTGDSIKIDFGGGSSSTNFKTNSWPIKIIDNAELINTSPSLKNVIELFLPEGDNNNPLIYQGCNIPSYTFPKNLTRHQSRFLNINYQAGYSNGITCATHNTNTSTIENVSSYIKLYYIRKQSSTYTPANNSIVYSSKTHFDNLFELHPQRVNFDSPYNINIILSGQLKFIDATDDLGFSGMVETGICKETNRVIYFAVPKDVHIATELATEKLITFTGGVSDKTSFFDFSLCSDYSKKVTVISISGINAKLISLEEKDGNDKLIKRFAENIFCLAISKTEFNQLNTQLSSFNTSYHPIYLGINSVTHSVDSSTQHIPYSELALSLKGLDSSALFYEVTTSNTLLTNSGNVLASPDASVNEIQTVDITQQEIYFKDTPYNFDVIFRLGANKSGNKWPLYKLNGSPEEIGFGNSNPVLLPLGARITALKIDYVNVPKLNKRKLKVYLWYSKQSFDINGFRLGYIDSFARRTFVIPRSTPNNYKDYPIEVLESFLNDMELYMFITLSNMNSISDTNNNYNVSKYLNYKQFVTATGNKVKQFRLTFQNALIDLNNSDPTSFNNLYTQFKNFYNDEVLKLDGNNYNTNIPLNKLTNGDTFYNDHVQAALDYYNIIKSTGVINNRFTIFVKSSVTTFTISNPNLGTTGSFTISQTDTNGTLEPAFISGILSLFGVSQASDLIDIVSSTIPNPNQVISRTYISSSNISEANGVLYTVNLKRQFFTQNLTSNNSNVILSNSHAIVPLDYNYLKNETSILNFIITNFKTGNENFLDMLIDSNWDTGFASDPISTTKLKEIFKKVATEIWGNSNSTYDAIKQTKVGIWLKNNYYNTTISNPIENLIILGDNTWASKVNPNLFFKHHGSLVGIDQSIGILNSNPVLSTSIHEANQSDMFISLVDGSTNTHNPERDDRYTDLPNQPLKVQKDWEDYTNDSIIPVYELGKSMRVLSINYHLPLVYIHHYLSKMNY